MSEIFIDRKLIRKLKDTKEFPSMTAFFRYLGFKDKMGGNERTKHIEAINNHVVYHREKNKIIIDKIRKIPLKPKKDKRKEGNHNNDKFSSIIQNLLLDFLVKNKGAVDGSVNYYISSLRMANYYYQLYEYNNKKLSELLNIDYFYVDEFYRLERNNFRSNLETAFENLQKRKLVTYNIFTFIKIKEDDEEYSRKATEIEEAIIYDSEQQILKEMGFINIQAINKARKYHTFTQKLNELTFEIANIEYSYDRYFLELKKGFDKKIIEGIDAEQLKKKLNKSKCENIVSNAINRHNDIVKKYIGFEENDIVNESHKNRHSNHYVEIYKLLAKSLIDISTARMIGN
jgi:hypothetical protein